MVLPHGLDEAIRFGHPSYHESQVDDFLALVAAGSQPLTAEVTELHDRLTGS